MSPLRRHASRFLGRVQALGVCTDASLAQALTEVGEGVDRSLVTKWRSGDRGAELGALWVLLAHVDEPAAVLDCIARDFGLQVTSIEVASRTDFGGELLDVVEHVGAVSALWRAARADGRIDEQEDRAITAALDALEREVRELRAARRRAT